MRWEMTGVHRETGADMALIVEADDEQGAIRHANALGLLVERAERPRGNRPPLKMLFLFMAGGVSACALFVLCYFTSRAMLPSPVLSNPPITTVTPRPLQPLAFAITTPPALPEPATAPAILPRLPISATTPPLSPAAAAPIIQAPAKPPDSPIEAIAASVVASPPPADEKWDLGPYDDVPTEIQVGETRGPDVAVEGEKNPDGSQMMMQGDLQFVTRRGTLIRRTQIASMRLTLASMEPVDPDDVMKRWGSRLNGILSPSEISLASEALNASRAAIIADPETGRPPAAAVGKRITVRVTGGYRTFVQIDLLWTDPNNPEVQHDWDLYPTHHFSEKEKYELSH